MFDYLMRVLLRKGWVSSIESVESSKEHSVSCVECSSQNDSSLSMTTNSSGMSANSL